ncbi:hypothetical protein [Micromonospora sp. WMMD1102]|uniref:hypothetical protein n=1 Tax=Micromonospora sp. WMMD1102 TaxID=3016105 RepID=UPI00324224AA
MRPGNIWPNCASLTTKLPGLVGAVGGERPGAVRDLDPPVGGRPETLHGEAGDQCDAAGFDVFPQPAAEGAPGRQGVGGLPAVAATRVAGPDRPGDLCPVDLAGEFGEREQGVRGGVAGADDQGVPAGEPLPAGAEDVG